jgi:hypothetical protein
MISVRTFYSVARRLFQKKPVVQFIKSQQTNLTAAVGIAGSSNGVVSDRWQPKNDNSFRSFAEYRLRVTNQSPLAVASKRAN